MTEQPEPDARDEPHHLLIGGIAPKDHADNILADSPGLNAILNSNTIEIIDMEDDEFDPKKAVIGLVIFMFCLQAVNKAFFQRDDHIRCKVPRDGHIIESTYRLVPSTFTYRSLCHVLTLARTGEEKEERTEDECRRLIMDDQVRGECEIVKRI